MAQAYPLAPAIHFLEDKDKKLTVQDIVTDIYRGDLPPKFQDSSIILDNSQSAYWMIFTIDNATDRTDWVIDFGDLSHGRSGLAKKMLLYDATNKAILFNRLQPHTHHTHHFINKNAVSAPLAKQASTTLILYIVPENYKVFKIDPTLKYAGYLHGDIESSWWDQGLFSVLLLSVATAIIGLVLTKAAGYIALILYYILSGLWLFSYETHLMSNNIIFDTIQPIFSILIAFVIIVTSMLSVPTHHNHRAHRIPLIFITIINSALFLSILFFPGYFSEINQEPAITLMVMVTYIVCINFLYTAKYNTSKTPAYYLMAWIGCLFIAHILIMLASMGIIPQTFETLYAEHLALYPQYLLLFIGVIVTISQGHKHIIHKINREHAKTKTLMRAHMGKEDIDNSRLLRVIEREREVMEELRARESERTEEMRHAKNTADQANQAKSAFLAIVSHEIRTPMTGIIGMLRMLENTTLTAEQKEYLDVVKDSSDTMLALLNDILDFSKIEQGGLTIERIEFDLKRVMMTVTTLMKTYADQKNVALDVHIDPHIQATLYGDPTRLRQVFLNLIGNALKFTHSGSVKVSAVLDRHDNKTDHVIFSVEDTGIGISEEALKNLFQPFSQADSSISRKYGGTGLGLVICKTLIEAMGGNIDVKSAEGVGTTFSFPLPFATTEDAISIASAPIAQNQEDLKPLKLLIIDDNDINIKVITELLAQDHHAITTQTSAKDALETLGTQSDFDAIMTDIEMPDMNGFDFAQNIFNTPDLQAIPLIAMTGNITPDDLEKYRVAGFTGYVGKPFDFDSIRALLSNIQNMGDEKKQFFDHHISLDHEDDTEKTSADTQPKRPKKKNIGKALDESMVSNLKNSLGSPQLMELMDELFTKSGEIIETLETAIHNDDTDAIYRQAHDLKGMCANYGLKALSEKSSEIELLTKDTDFTIDGFKPHLEDLKTLEERSKIAIEKFLEQ